MNFTDLNDFEGLQFMPVKENKLPVHKEWQTTSKKYDLSNCSAVGLVCGKLSGGLEVVDIDLKYDITGKLFNRYKKLIHESDPDLLEKLVVQKTKSGGYHFIYRCSVIEGNLKLANRQTTEQERADTYSKNLEGEIKKGKSQDEAAKIAKRSSDNDTVRVLLETRGEGGYIMCYPSKGYELTFRDYYGITEITPSERETIINIARQFNEIVEEYKPANRNEYKKTAKGATPFEDFNDRGDVVLLLEKYGWTFVKNKGDKALMLRPGQSDAAHSGNYDHGRKWFSVFTTSTEFDPQKAYLPYAVYAILECKGDFKEAARRLYDEGYGERIERQREINAKVPSKVNLIDDDLSFLEKDENFDEYLQMAREGTLPLGLKTNMPLLDKHFLFKRGDLVMINGVDNVGKTIVILFLMLLAAMYHGWNFIIFSCENTNRSLVKRLIEFYWGKKIEKVNDVEFKVAKQFVTCHFKFIKTEEDLFNYKDILNMTKKAMSKYKFDGGLIDPYNGLKIELTNASKLNTHEYHYEAISEVKQFGTKNDFSWFINNHAVTASLRQKDVNGFQKAPGKEDTEGGGKFSNKAAQFITIHRITQHPKEWMVTELHIRKVKETETGGHVTPKDTPVKIAMKAGGCGFQEVKEIVGGGELIFGIDPIAEWHKVSQPIQLKIVNPPFETKGIPYKDDDGNDAPF